MEYPKPFASLTPRLLARKGGARPAMRQQLGTCDQIAPARQEDELGWDDLGDDVGAAEQLSAEIVPIRSLQKPEARPVRRVTPLSGRKSAFTLRLDAERHLKLRLACTLDDRSAQQLVTDALDRLLADMPELSALADHVGKQRQS